MWGAADDTTSIHDARYTVPCVRCHVSLGYDDADEPCPILCDACQRAEAAERATYGPCRHVGPESPVMCASCHDFQRYLEAGGTND